jgi:20S proteasome alpha/beta subunit
MSEQRPGEQTRFVLRSFGVMVTTFEEQMTQLLERTQRNDLTVDDALELAAQALALSMRLSRRLREVNELVLSLQERSLGELRARLAKRFPAMSAEPEE